MEGSVKLSPKSVVLNLLGYTPEYYFEWQHLILIILKICLSLPLLLFLHLTGMENRMNYVLPVS